MIKLVTQYSHFEKQFNKEMNKFQNNPSIEWVQPKSTHAHPLVQGNNKVWISSGNVKNNKKKLKMK